MGQDEFALVVDVKAKPGLEREYERLMLAVVERQTAEPTYIGTSVHRDPDDPTHFVLYEVWRDPENAAFLLVYVEHATNGISVDRAAARP